MNYNWRQLDIRSYAVMASLLASLFTLVFPDSPNDDAYTYIKTAEIFLSDGLRAAFEHYAWASYSILIALVSKLGFDLFTSAYLLNACFFALLVFAFVSIVKEIDDSRLVVTLAAICILVYPQLNEYRYFIIRDIGFWTLSIFAFWQYLLYARTRSIKYALGFCGTLLVAAAFRAEAIVYLLVTPFALLFDTRYPQLQCRQYFFKLIVIVVVAGLVLIGLLTIFGMSLLDLVNNFFSVYLPFISSTFNPSDADISELGRLLFNEHAASYSREYIAIFMAAGLFTILLANLFNAIGGPYLIILAIGFVRKNIRFPREVLTPMLAYLLVNISILFVFLFITRFLSSRYAMLFCILLVLFVPLILAQLYRMAKEKGLRNGIRLMMLFLVYCTIDSYYSFGYSKGFVFDAIDWVEDNANSSAGLVTNNHAIAYYTGRVENYDRVLRNLTEPEILSTKPGDLIVVEINYEMEQLLASDAIALHVQLLIAFPDTSEQKLAIYSRLAF